MGAANIYQHSAPRGAGQEWYPDNEAPKHTRPPPRWL